MNHVSISVDRINSGCVKTKQSDKDAASSGTMKVSYHVTIKHDSISGHLPVVMWPLQ